MRTKGNYSRHASPLALRDEKGKGTNVDGEFQFDWWEEEGGTGEENLVVDQDGNESALLPVDRLNIQATIMEERVDWGEEVRLFTFREIYSFLDFQYTVEADSLHTCATSKRRVHDTSHSSVNYFPAGNLGHGQTRLHHGM